MASSPPWSTRPREIPYAEHPVAYKGLPTHFLTGIFTAFVGGAYIALGFNQYVIVLGTCLGLLAASVFRRATPRALTVALVGSALCVAPIFISAIVNQRELRDVAAPATFIALASVAASLGAALQPGQFRDILVRAAGFSCILLLLGAIIYSWDLVGAIVRGARLDPGIHPNLFGLIAVTIFAMAANSRNKLYVTAVFLMAFMACLAVSSRGSLLTLCSVGLITAVMSARKPSTFLVIGTFAALVFTASLPSAREAFEGLVSQVFQLNDQHRGLATGASGRSVIWSYYLENIKHHPIFGLGVGQRYMIGGREFYTHNIALQLLVDGGLLLVVGFASFIIWTLVRVRQVEPSTRRAFYIFLITYLVYGMFEGRAVNVGNPLSVMFFFTCFVALASPRSTPANRMETSASR